MTNKNYQIATFYARLFEMKAMIDNELLPLGVHVAVLANDAKLFESLEILSTDINEHLETFELVVTSKRDDDEEKKVLPFPHITWR